MITMGNYEGWLMRYADGALTREEREAVEAFLEQHPELREEMEDVAGVKVTPVVATLPGKERLLKKDPSFCFSVSVKNYGICANTNDCFPRAFF